MDQFDKSNAYISLHVGIALCHIISLIWKIKILYFSCSGVNILKLFQYMSIYVQGLYS